MSETQTRGWVFAGYGVITVFTVLALRPSTTDLTLFPHADKAIHVGFFFLAGAALAAARAPWRAFSIHAGVFALIGAGVEAAQHAFVPGRTGDVWDFVSDVAGLTLAACVAKVWR